MHTRFFILIRIIYKIYYFLMKFLEIFYYHLFLLFKSKVVKFQLDIKIHKFLCK